MQMGLLKALGYTNSDIMLYYQIYPLLVGILGSFIGTLIGIFYVGSTLLNIFITISRVIEVEKGELILSQPDINVKEGMRIKLNKQHESNKEK